MRALKRRASLLRIPFLAALAWWCPAVFGQTIPSSVAGDETPTATSSAALPERWNAIAGLRLSSPSLAHPLLMHPPGLEGFGDAAQTEPKAGGSQEPSLGDLGITPEQAKGNAAEQARLDRRSHMLKIHQRLGLITIAPLVATLIASGSAGEKHTGSGRAVHAGLGSATVGMYLTTASFAIFAPKVHTETCTGGSNGIAVWRIYTGPE